MRAKNPSRTCGCASAPEEHEHRSLMGTPFRACSMWLPQPFQVAFRHFLHIVRLHMCIPLSHDLYAGDKLARGGRVSPGFVATVKVSSPKAKLRKKQSGHVPSLSHLAIHEYVSSR